MVARSRSSLARPRSSLVALSGSEPAKLTAEPALRARRRRRGADVARLAALSVAGARARDGRTILMGTAFSTMTALFAVHALATPGFLVGKNGMIALAGGLSVPVGAGLLALTALPALRRPAESRPARRSRSRCSSASSCSASSAC